MKTKTLFSCIVLGVLFASTALLSSCRSHTVNGDPPEPPRLIPTPSEHHFGAEGGTVVLTFKAEAGLRYEEVGMSYASGTTNRNGVVMDRHLNPSAPYWEEFDVELTEPPQRRLVRLRTEWFELKRNEALNQITVTVEPNTSGNVRKVVVAMFPYLGMYGTLVPITQAASSN